MTDQRKQHITLRLDAHQVSINVPAHQEHLYRLAAKALNEKYHHYQRKMQTSSAEQLWVYVALDMAVNLQAESHVNRMQPIEEKIKELNNIILQQLNKD
ncbi:MAG: cell division protein ZapA [Kiritimatiellae bacterium]|jgi:cell division protein ZapA (FtsZ GTPase activity inhibitor)|nr:cell division protein ZapA [Kiritimatiellia bacterium]